MEFQEYSVRVPQHLSLQKRMRLMHLMAEAVLLWEDETESQDVVLFGVTSASEDACD